MGLVAAAFIVSLFLPSLTGIDAGGLFGGGAPDGPGEKIASQGREHVTPDQEHPPYNSTPATSGWHYEQPLAPVVWGVHDEFVADEFILHNLEHGGIGIHFDCPDGCDDLVAQLAEIVDRSRAEDLKVMMSPYPDMPTRIALTAWTFMDVFEEFDNDRIAAFIESHESSPNSPEPNAY